MRGGRGGNHKGIGSERGAMQRGTGVCRKGSRTTLRGGSGLEMPIESGSLLWACENGREEVRLLIQVAVVAARLDPPNGPSAGSDPPLTD